MLIFPDRGPKVPRQGGYSSSAPTAPLAPPLGQMKLQMYFTFCSIFEGFFVFFKHLAVVAGLREVLFALRPALEPLVEWHSNVIGN